jgi:selenocysteine lyase/cysteine desulfurase
MINTPADKTRSCGIANVGLKNMKPAELAKRLYEQYNIYTVAIDGAGVHGCRITPNVYTTLKELDVFVKAMKELSKV